MEDDKRETANGIKALSIRQPWATMIAKGYKDIENRDWRYKPSYRGQLLIHASKKFDTDGAEWIKRNIPDVWAEIISENGHTIFSDLFPTGGFVGLCEMKDVVEMHGSIWFTGPLGFVLDNQKEIEFIPHKGQLKLWNPPDLIFNVIKVKRSKS